MITRDGDVGRQQHVQQRRRHRHEDHQHAGDHPDRQNQIWQPRKHGARACRRRSHRRHPVLPLAQGKWKWMENDRSEEGGKLLETASDVQVVSPAKNGGLESGGRKVESGLVHRDRFAASQRCAPEVERYFALRILEANASGSPIASPLEAPPNDLRRRFKLPGRRGR